ncbi:unnamed protein product [Durusdinium trenchii]|uniref:Transmembrane protein n=1 Tax=Durusdinium trenchii TaxID=1381693 RepID=A0ABP0LQZ4_9DINO
MSFFPCLKVKNEKWWLFSWVVVTALYALPTLFYARRIYEVWHAPLLQTSQSDDWGRVPELWFCSVEPLNIETCVLQSFRTVDGSELNGSKGESLCQIISPPKKHEQQKIQLGTGKGFGDKLDEPKGQFEILPPQFKDQFEDSYCQAINATALKPSSPSRLFLGGDASKSFGLYYVMRDHCADTCHHPIFLTRAFPGIAELLLTKVRKGSMQMSADPYAPGRSFISSFNAFVSPELYDAFSTQLLFVNSRVIPTQDGEMYWSQVFPKVPTPSAWELIVRLDPHVREEVEVGRLAHCIIFLARLGGYLSIVSGLLAFCWVQRYKVDKQTHLAQTLEELLNEETFVLDTLSPQHNDHFEPLTGDLVSINLKKKLEGRKTPSLRSFKLTGAEAESDLESSSIEPDSAWCHCVQSVRGARSQ